MFPRIAIGRVSADGSPPLPGTLGATSVWTRRAATTIGDCPAWEYRSGGSTTDDASAHLVTIQRVALCTLPDASAGAVWIAWVPAALRDGSNPIFAALAPALVSLGILLAYWPGAADGTIPAVEADPSPAALAVLAAWPATWRVRLPTDAPGDPFAVPPVPAAPPSGPRCIGAGLA